MLVAASTTFTQGTMRALPPRQCNWRVIYSFQTAYGRKLREIMVAVQVEHRYAKPQIFTLYANT
jgi:membrane peptidoglycan carboxypeptidase